MKNSLHNEVKITRYNHRQDRYISESERMENIGILLNSTEIKKSRKNEEEKPIEGTKIWENYQKYHNPPRRKTT